jgi:hypothetical protein
MEISWSIVLWYVFHLGVALFGSLLYNVGMWVLAKSKFDAQDKDFDFKTYKKHNYDNWIFATLCGPVLVWYLPDVVHLANTYFLKKFFSVELPVLGVLYMGAGPLSEFILFAISYVAGRKSGILPSTKQD